ncbi:AaceriADL279Wp [[Ashbya] aceris (nom. inval.)]|nr:AaceriADL279Wp [[Ashbya] aceris (nom. inval.)]
MLNIALWFLVRGAGGMPVELQRASPRSATVFPDDGEMDMDFVLFTFSLVFMLLCYGMMALIYLGLRFVVRRCFTRRIALSSSESSRADSGEAPTVLDDELEVRHKLAYLSPEEQFYYKQGEEFIKQNPPLLMPYQTVAGGGSHGEPADAFDPVINDETLRYIEEEGAQAWEFQPSPSLPPDFVKVENRTEVIFMNSNSDVSVTTNLPIPLANKVYYFECKIFELCDRLGRPVSHLPENQMVSFGLATAPYPYFRLPGRHHHSVAYDSNGARRLNNSFKLPQELSSPFPRCEKGDVIGIGYRTRSGTVFFTRNGKKLSEKRIGGHIKGWKIKYLYPIVGANVPCKIHVNFGTYGFVYIEANVKKWGYAKLNGMKMPPPAYEDYDRDVLLESSYEDEVSEGETSSFADHLHDGHLLPPPPGFEFSTTPTSNCDQFTLNTLPTEPPGYTSDAVAGPKRNAGVGRSENAQSDSPAAELNANTFANQFINDSSPKR